MTIRTIGLLTLALCAGAAPRVAVVARQPATESQSSKIWIGRYAEFEDFLRTAEIVEAKSIGVGVTVPQHAFFKPGGLAAGGVLKAIEPGILGGYWDSYKSEIAAYRMDRLLELDMVPPTVEVRVGGRRGRPASLQLWVEHTIMLKDVQDRKLTAPDGAKWNRQADQAYLFDDLIANTDENPGNLLFDREWNFIKVDHSRAFTETLKQPFEIGRMLNHIDRTLFDRVKRLDRAAVKREIGDLLETGALDALFRRRDEIVKDFERLAAQKGEANVFLP